MRCLIWREPKGQHEPNMNGQLRIGSRRLGHIVLINIHEHPTTNISCTHEQNPQHLIVEFSDPPAPPSGGSFAASHLTTNSSHYVILPPAKRSSLMLKIAGFISAVCIIAAGSSNANADKRGIGDRTITDHSKVGIHQRYPGDARAGNADNRYEYREKCHWYFKKTDGWWPSQPTQRCVRVRVN